MLVKRRKTGPSFLANGRRMEIVTDHQETHSDTLVTPTRVGGAGRVAAVAGRASSAPRLSWGGRPPSCSGNGNNINSNLLNKVAAAATASNSNTTPRTQRVTIQRVPIMSGLSISGALMKPFQRPSQKRRIHAKAADAALKTSSLGMKRRTNGMQNILERAGRPLHFLLPKSQQQQDKDAESSSGEESEPEEDKPFEPLRLWTSPHQGGEPVGLPPRM